MSHLVKIKTVLTDMEAVKETCRELGLTFKEGQRTYKWWGRSVGDYPMPQGVTKDDLGKCDHAIGIPGTDWEVGVFRLAALTPRGKPTYTLLFDFYGSNGAPILKALGGQEGKRFSQIYTVNKATLEARAKGHQVVREVQPTGKIKLKVYGGRSL